MIQPVHRSLEPVLSKHAICLCLSGLIAVVFCSLVAYFSVNIPQQDDYDSILFYLLESGDNFLSGLAHIHVSHRLVLTRLLARLSLATGHGVDFRLLIYSGTLCLSGAVLLLYRTFHPLPQRSLALLLLCLGGFSLYHWSNMIWASAAVQNYAGLLAAVACFSLFNQGTPTTRTAAILTGLGAPYISSNGLLLLPLLLGWTLAETGRSGAHRRTAILLTLICLFSLLVYFSLPGGSTAALRPPLRPTDFMVILTAYLITCGGFLHFAPLALAAGLTLNGYFLYLVASRYYRSNSVVFTTLLYLLLSLMLVALYRHPLGTAQLIASRYQVYTLLAFALAACSALEQGLDRRLPFSGLRYLMVVGFTLLYLASFYYLGNLNSEKAKLSSGLSSWQSGAENALYHPQPGRAAALLRRAIDASLYYPPEESALPP